MALYSGLEADVPGGAGARYGAVVRQPSRRHWHSLPREEAEEGGLEG